MHTHKYVKRLKRLKILRKNDTGFLWSRWSRIFYNKTDVSKTARAWVHRYGARRQAPYKSRTSESHYCSDFLCSTIFFCLSLLVLLVFTFIAQFVVRPYRCRNSLRPSVCLSVCLSRWWFTHAQFNVSKLCRAPHGKVMSPVLVPNFAGHISSVHPERGS